MNETYFRNYFYDQLNDQNKERKILRSIETYFSEMLIFRCIIIICRMANLRQLSSVNTVLFLLSLLLLLSFLSLKSLANKNNCARCCLALKQKLQHKI